MATCETRRRANVLITGTPGTGKSTLAEQVASTCGMEYIDVATIVKENEFYEEYDETNECHVLDEEALLDFIEEKLDSTDGGCMVDYHGSDLFPRRCFDLVAVLRCDNTVLYDRLKLRKYNEHKITQNVQCEIFNVLGEEATNSYDENVVKQLQSSNVDEMAANVEWCSAFIAQWRHPYGVSQHDAHMAEGEGKDEGQMEM